MGPSPPRRGKISNSMKMLKQNVVLILVFLLTLLSHGWNYGGYPAFEGDEGTYTSQGWWIVRMGDIAPYSYWYDHSPFGWLTIGVWQLATGGPFTLGFSLLSTRLFMVLVAGVTNLFLYLLAYRLTKSVRASLMASLLFAFSPIAIFFHRRVLLDNLMTMWFVLSLYFLWRKKGNMLHLWISGLCFGLAFLSKEVTIIFLPVMIYALWGQTKGENGRFSKAVWCMSAFFLMSFFPLLAILKHEFFPAGWVGDVSRVSLVDTIVFQMTRGVGKQLWESTSQFQMSLRTWFGLDGFLTYFGAISAVIVFLFHKLDARYRMVSLMVFSFIIFLARGGLVMDFYIVPLLPLLCLSFALFLTLASTYLGGIWNRRLVGIFTIPAYLLLIFSFLVAGKRLYLEQATQSQIASVAYTRETLPPDARVIVDAWAYLDMRLPRTHGEKYFVNAEWFSKILLDPAIRDKKFGNDWRNIDYILLTHEMIQLMNTETDPSLLRLAMKEGKMIKDFPPLDPGTRNISRMYSVSADWATLLGRPSLFSESL